MELNEKGMQEQEILDVSLREIQVFQEQGVRAAYKCGDTTNVTAFGSAPARDCNDPSVDELLAAARNARDNALKLAAIHCSMVPGDCPDPLITGVVRCHEVGCYQGQVYVKMEYTYRCLKLV